MKRLSHFDERGAARMVDVSAKPATLRTARAQALVRIRPAVLKKLPENPKGDPLQIARIAGIAAAKRTADLIPLCHPLMLTHVDVDVRVQTRGVRIVSTASALAALTLYDMLKSLDKGVEIQDLFLLEKTGGKSGAFRRKRSPQT